MSSRTVVFPVPRPPITQLSPSTKASLRPLRKPPVTSSATIVWCGRVSIFTRALVMPLLDTKDLRETLLVLREGRPRRASRTSLARHRFRRHPGCMQVGPYEVLEEIGRGGMG